MLGTRVYVGVVAGLGAVGMASGASAQSCDRVLGVNGEGLSWVNPAVHSTQAEATSALVWDSDLGGPLGPWLVVGGQFDRAGDATANNIAIWDGSAWRTVGSGTNGRVKGLALGNAAGFRVGGDFTSAGGVAGTKLLAAWNGLNWLPGVQYTGGAVENWAAGSVVLGLSGKTSGGGDSFIYGQLYPEGRSSAFGYELWQTDGTNISSIGCDSFIGLPGGLDCPPGEIQFIEPNGSDLWAICGPTRAFPPAGDRIAFRHDPFNGYNWDTVLAASGYTYNTLKRIGGTYYAGGRAPDGTPFLSKSISVQIAPFVALQSVTVPNTGQGSVTAVVGRGSGVAAAMGYVNAGSGDVTSVVFDLTTPTPSLLGAFFNGRINDLIEYNGSIYAVGRFTQVGLRTCRGIAKFDGTDWVPLISAGFDVYPAALATFGNALWAGGNFGQIGSVSAFYLAREIDGVWQPVTTAGPNGPVTALSYYTTNPTSGITQQMIVGGLFSQVGSVGALNIAAYRYTGGILDIQPMGSGVNGAPRAMLSVNTSISHNDLIVGGDFTQAGGVVNTARIARWTGSAWQALGFGTNDSVRALASFGGQIIAGGSFTVAGGNAAQHVAAWNGTSWSAMGAGLNDTVRALAVYNGQLYAGGDFTVSGATSVGRIARWNGTAWESPGIGVDGSVWAMRPVDTDLWLGGVFADAFPGPVHLNHIGIFNGTTVRPIGQGLGNTVVALGQRGADVFASATTPPYFFRATPDRVPSVFISAVTPPCVETMSTFIASTTNCTGGTLRWRRNGISIADGVTPTGGIAIGSQTPQLSVYPASAAESGTYDCVITCPCGVATSEPLAVAFTSPPRILVQPSAGTFCVGQPQDLEILADGTPPLIYSWYRDGNLVLTTTDPITTVSNPSAADAGAYTCVVSNACGSVTSQSVVRTLVTPPVISSQPGARAVCPGGSASFAVSASAGVNFRWYRNNAPLSDRAASPGAGSVAGALTQTLVLGQVAVGDGGYYACHVSRPGGGCTTVSDQALLTVATNACCLPDYNGDHVLNVQDVFDFLNGWLGGQVAADFNHADGLSVQDIFDFLNAWFAGC